jgi:hypothetical protein
MSALAVIHHTLFVRTGRPITELDATRRISRAGALATGLTDGIEAFANIALQTSGIVRVELAPGAPLLSQIPKVFVFDSSVAAITRAMAEAEIAAAGKKWGELRVFFELQPSTIENPLRFAKFLGQQIGVLLTRVELLVERESLKRKAALFKTLVTRRKAIHRARALLIHTHNISEDEALTLLRRYTLETGHTMHQVAEAIVFSDQQKWRQVRGIPFPATRDRSRYRRTIR